MSDSPPRQPRVRPIVALAFCLVGFFALLVAGLGFASLLLDADVIAVPDVGQAPGVVGVAACCAAFAAALWAGVRQAHPSFWSVVVVVASSYLGYVLGTAMTATVATADVATGLAVAGGLAAGWQALVVAVSALAAGWSGIALVRTRAERPRWPWERREP